MADDYLPLLSNATGKEIAKAFRPDGQPPAKDKAASDKRACLLDSREIPANVVDRLTTLSRTNREAAEIEVTKAVIPCMRKKGWRIELTPGV
jgi:hypothetical protein